MLRSTFLIAAIYGCRSSFLQCSPSDSLEPIDNLDGSEHAHMQLVNCDQWPFYSGGMPRSNGYSDSHSSSSSSEDSSDEDDRSLHSLLPTSIDSDHPIYGFDDGIETTKCLVTNDNGVCMKWTVTKQEYEDEYGCGAHRSDGAKLLTDNQLCQCATVKGKFCVEWACLDLASDDVPTDYTLIKDNQFVADKADLSNPLIGDFWRFADNDGMVKLSDNMQLKNCWCQTDDCNADACDDWFCGTLRYHKWDCKTGDFEVDGFGRFGCYEADNANVNSTLCDNWYGFMYHGDDLSKWHNRDEYRCQCVDHDCTSTICGLKQIPLRQNWLWFNFPLAFILWSCLCGCCGTKMCYKQKRKMYEDEDPACYVKVLKCRKFRMSVFVVLTGGLALLQGGLPAFLFFCILFSLSLCCAVKKEKYGGRCGRGRCCGMKRWMQKQQMNCEAKQTKKGMDTYQGVSVKETDGANGENSKEESVDAVEMKVVE